MNKDLIIENFWSISWKLKVILFEIFIFCPKIQLWFPEKIVDFFGWKSRESVVVLDYYLAVDNFNFTRKIAKKILGEKLVKMLGVCQIFGQRKMTFRILFEVI